MSQLPARFLPSATNMIRIDHTHVLSTFHQYKASAPPRVRKALANTICTALEVHAQLEEEIFYPAVREAVDAETLGESIEEHQEMKRLIGLLRRMEPAAHDYDETVFALMRDVMHHVADEETIVLPAAEIHLADRLGDLGLQMTKRRIQLVAPRTAEIATDMACAASGNKVMLGLGALMLGGLLLATTGARARRHVLR